VKDSSRELEFARLVTELEKQGPEGPVGAEMASFLYQVVKNEFRRRDLDNVVGVVWIELQIGLGRDPKIAPKSPLSLAWLMERTHHKLRSEHVRELHGVCEEDVREGRWKQTRKAVGLGKKEIMLHRVGMPSDWEQLLDGLPEPDKAGVWAFDELCLLLTGLGLSETESVKAITVLINQASKPHFSRKACLRALTWLPADTRESLVELTFAVDGYVVPRLMGHSQESAVGGAGFGRYADALLRRKAALQLVG
jgi:hypothetical protein